MNAKAMLAMFAVGALGLASAAKIVAYPYDGATLLAGQKFDLRIEVSGIEGSLSNYSVTLNGKPVAGLVQSSQGAGQVEWTLRNTQLPGGAHTLAVQVTDAKGLSQRNFAWAGKANPALPQGAKKVIVFVGDGLGWNTINAARIIAKGYNTETGVANGYLEMMTGFGGSATVVNSSFDSFITDSANSAAGIFSGQKMQVNALNVYPDNTADTLDNPRIETLGEILKRVRGAGVGIVSNTFGTDATPASLVAHTRRRGDYQAIADQYFKGAAQPDVMLLGGSRDFIPKSAAGSRRNDATDWIAESQKMGFTFVSDRTELMNVQAPNKLFGLFNIDNFPGYLDRAVYKRPEMLGSFTNQPYLWEMTQKAVETLEKNPNGFILAVEAGMVDKYLHPLDWQRGLWDVLEMDRAVEWAKGYAARNPDTLVIVTADHAHSISVYGGYDYSKTGRAGVGVYDAAKFPTYGDQRDVNGFPLPQTQRGIAVGFAGAPDYCETYGGFDVYKSPTISDGKGGWVANPEICKEPGAVLRVGNLDPASSQGVHTADPLPLFAWGNGAQIFNGFYDQTNIFFLIAQAMGLNPAAEQR